MKESFQMKIVEWNLSNESCRRCGGDLTKYSLCAICKHTMQHVCLQCGFRSEEIPHLFPITNGTYQTRNSRIENTYIILV